jgi:D-alanyl-D-alanine carboxypeptidase
MNVSAPIRIASVTKLYTATVVMRLEEQGLLALDDPMAKYLPHALIDRIAVRDGIAVGTLIGPIGYYMRRRGG